MEKLNKRSLFNKLKKCINENHCTIIKDDDIEIKNSKYFTLLNYLKNEMDYIYSCYTQIIKDPQNMLKLTNWDYEKDTKDIEKDLLEAKFIVETTEKILDLDVSTKKLIFTFKNGKLITLDYLLVLDGLEHYYFTHFHRL